MDLVELNSSFYALPTARNAARWAELLEPHPAFRFSAKLHRSFTHEAWRSLPRHDVEAYREGLRPLQEAGRLEALLAQFPVSFRESPDGWSRLGRLRDAFSDAPLVVELRHRSWFTERALARIDALDTGLAWIDLPAARDHPPLGHPTPGPIAYARLHGRNAKAWFDKNAGRDQRYDWLYGPHDLEQIAERIREMAAGGRKTFLVTNNHYGGKAVANALEVKGLLEGAHPRAPTVLRDAFPHLRDRTEPEGQQSLF